MRKLCAKYLFFELLIEVSLNINAIQAQLMQYNKYNMQHMCVTNIYYRKKKITKHTKNVIVREFKEKKWDSTSSD